ncbi:hypothetical protein ACQ4PT_010347 [Festuca glaucescens]
MVFKYHAEAGILNLYSLHAWLGVTTAALYTAQWLAGFLAFFFPGAAPETRRSVVLRHAVLGLLIFALAVGTAQFGFLEKMSFLQSPPARLVANYGRGGRSWQFGGPRAKRKDRPSFVTSKLYRKMDMNYGSDILMDIWSSNICIPHGVVQ